MPSKSSFSNCNVMAVVALVGSIYAASADEASDAVQVLSKLWAANIDASYCGGSKILKTKFVGDGKIYRMRSIFQLEDGKVDDSVEEAPFRILEEGLPKGIVHCDHLWAPSVDYFGTPPPSSVVAVGVRCLFGRDCIETTTLTYDPIYKPNAPPKKRRSGGGPPPPEGLPVINDPISLGAVEPANADAVRRALRTLLQLNAAPPFDPLAPR